MSNVADIFATAWQHHQANDLSKAEQLYWQVLRMDDAHADAWCFLGVVCQTQGKIVEAEAALRRAIQLMPCHACALNCLGILLAQKGQLEPAAAVFEQLLQCHSEDAVAHNNLGLVRAQQGRYDDAVARYEQALRVQPDFPAARINLENAQQQRKNHKSQLQSQDFQVSRACLEAAQAAIRQGVAFAHQGRIDDAKSEFEKAALLQPDSVDAHNDLGSVLVQQNQFHEAVLRFQKVLSLKPDHVEAHYNLALALQKQNKLDEAIACYMQALRFRPQHVDARNNLANIYLEQGNTDEAAICLEQALYWNPHHAWTHLNRALLNLIRGNWSQGWPEYEWRWQTEDFPLHDFQRPRWEGGCLAGRKILVFAEQGLGDTIQFIRYLPLLRKRGAQVIFQCQPALRRLLANAQGIDCLVPRDCPLPPFDLQAPLMSLPGITGTRLDDVPADIPYLQADTTLEEHWRRRLGPRKGLKIGIAWQGSPTFRHDRRRSIPLATFKPLAQVPEVQLISLQKGPGVDQLRKLAGQFHVQDFGADFDEVNGAFMDTAAIMKSLDLVISSDTAVAHLAGALGVPAWVPISVASDWRWLLKREDSPWYPSMRLFRQARLGQWDSVFERMAEEVKDLYFQRASS